MNRSGGSAGTPPPVRGADTDFRRCRERIDLGYGEVEVVRPSLLSTYGYPGVDRLPICLQIILESMLRNVDDRSVTASQIDALAGWQPNGKRTTEVPFIVGRVVLNDMAGIPLVGDLAAMRSALDRAGLDPARVKPRVRDVTMVIDHTLAVDYHGTQDARWRNEALELERNAERFALVKWAGNALPGLRVVPPGFGILHQVNLEHLHPGLLRDGDLCYPDTLVGTDSHTCMIAGVSVVGWGVGGIEAQSALLGEPVMILEPDVVGVNVIGALREGVSSTDLVLYATQKFRAAKVVGALLEFHGPGVRELSVPDRATLANMAPEYGATIGFFPLDDVTVRYLHATGRDPLQVAGVEAYFRHQGWFAGADAGARTYSRVITLDLSVVVPCIAGPKRPQDSVPLAQVGAQFRDWLVRPRSEGGLARPSPGPADNGDAAQENAHEMRDGDIAIASITSCTNTSNPRAMLAAGLLARNAVARGLRARPWVKTSLAPGSLVVSHYLEACGLQAPLDRLGFNVVGYGCATCVGNSGPIEAGVESQIVERDLVACAILSGNRNFEGRIHPLVKAAYLASPALVVAYAIAGRVDIDPVAEPLAIDAQGADVYLRDLWPGSAEVDALAECVASRDAFLATYGANFGAAAPTWEAIAAPDGPVYPWADASTYIREPPYFKRSDLNKSVLSDIDDARALLILGDSVTTDHISPIGHIADQSPAADYLRAHGVRTRDFSSYGSRRLNHEVMIRGTFANVRLRNRMVEQEGGVTTHQPDGRVVPVSVAADLYAAERVPLLVFAGKEYGTGSARDWAAKGTRLLGVRAVIAESFERIHRSNLVGMGVLPLQLPDDVTVESLGLTGSETFELRGLDDSVGVGAAVALVVYRDRRAPADDSRSVTLRLRADTTVEVEYLRQGGVLPYLLSRLIAA